VDAAAKALPAAGNARHAIDASDLVVSWAYAIVYALAIVALAIAAFRRRELT